MPRKPVKPTNLQDLLDAVPRPAYTPLDTEVDPSIATFESLPDYVDPAVASDRTDAHERAQTSESTILGERASSEERTITTERAHYRERTQQPERSRFTFASRVHITDGFQYLGSFVNAPAWVDRNWLVYDYSPPKPYKPGPSLVLPDGERCRFGDWVVKETVEGTQHRMVIYTDDEMQHFFRVTPSAVG